MATASSASFLADRPATVDPWAGMTGGAGFFGNGGEAGEIWLGRSKGSGDAVLFDAATAGPAVGRRPPLARPASIRAASTAAIAHPFGRLPGLIAAMRGPTPRSNDTNSRVTAGAGRLRVVIISGPLTSGA